MNLTPYIRKYAKKTNQNLGDVARNVKIDLFTGVIMDTLVDTGRLRGNWQTSTDAAIYSEIDRTDKIEMHTPGGDAFKEAILNVTPFGIDYMTNNLVYAEIREERDGMIAKNIQRVERNLKKEVARVS